MAANGQVSAFNLPNVLTSIRILLVPFFVWALWQSGYVGRRVHAGSLASGGNILRRYVHRQT